MVNKIRTLDFLPEVFRTSTNSQFLAATLDQLTSQPDLRRVEGFIGSKYGYGVAPTDKYVVEPTKTRANYQLDPSVVFLKKDTQTAQDFINYPGIIDALNNEGAVTNNNNRLFNNQFYSWDSFIDLDKVVNYSQYYWIPNGPDAIAISSGIVQRSKEYIINNADNGFQFDGITGLNPTLTLLRGGTYTFTVDQTTEFWIQGVPGVTGYGAQTNLSTRDVLGVTNNGATVGTVTFTVPAKDAQTQYDLPGNNTVDLVTSLTFSQLNGASTTTVTNIDGVTELNNKTVMFYNNGDPSSQVNFYTISISIDGTTITLINPVGIPSAQNITAVSGTQWVNRNFFRNSIGVIELISYQSAILDTLYYQDGTDPLSVGKIVLIENNDNAVIDVAAIIGKKSFNTDQQNLYPSDLQFINGLKITFDSATVPSSYRNQQFYVEGVGSSIKLLPANEYLAVESSGSAVYLPWESVPWDINAWDQLIYIPIDPDYLTISRNSRDRNAWTRSNRWFNKQVLDATIKYNGTVTDTPNNTPSKAQRPIIEFQGNLRLYNSGIEFIGFVDLFSTSSTDALANIQGANPATVTVDGVNPISGSKIVFANDVDLQVRRTIYEYNIVNTGTTLIAELTPLIQNISDNQQVTVFFGNQNTQTSWRYDTNTWLKDQQKITTNQAPLFDIFDKNSISLSNATFYNGSSFTGTKLFSYAPGTGTDDPVLGFPISYSGVNNIGDIQFDVNFNSDTFEYVLATVPQIKNINIGYVHYSPVIDTVVERTGWVPAVAESVQYQVFEYTVTFPTQSIFTCDIPAVNPASTPWNNSQVYYNDRLLDNTEYTTTVNTNGTTTITLNAEATLGDKVTVLILSDQVSTTAYYEVPANLVSNPFNTNVTVVDVGDLRNQYRTIYSNAPDVVGTLFGSNNIYNLGDTTGYGTAIIQNSASLVLPGVFLRKPSLNLFEALQYNSDEYIDYKLSIVDITNQIDFRIYQSPAEMLNTVIYQISSTKNSTDSFFWSDMLPSISPYRTNTYTINAAIPSTTYPLGRVYDFSNANFYGLGVYLIRQQTVPGGVRPITTQMTKGVDYIVSDISPSVTVTYDFIAGDQITIKEYNQTYGSYCPNTPTKLGLYQSFIPQVILDNTYTNPTWFIKGHDGSYNKLYGTYDPTTGILTDFRDQVLLEFELRIYNNLKVSGAIPLTYVDVFPGQFRTTEFSRDELLSVYSTQFLRWIGKNRIDYKEQIYNAINQFTYNYNQTTNRLSDTQMQQGYWRGIYDWFYDTSNPAAAPWELLGFTDQPTWWTSRYGIAPYTSDNILLWNDLAEGYVWNNGAPYIEPTRARPELLQVLPVDGAGNLVAPQTSTVSAYNSLTYQRNWVVGDGAPAEASYLRSSTWPFDLMRILALTKPAKFFNLFVDRDRYKYNSEFNQYLYDEREHLNPRTVEVYGNGVSKASYINWIVDYINQRGVDGTTLVTDTLQNLDVRLTYNIAGFSAKNYLQFLIEKSTPNTQNSSLLVPDDSYAVLLYDNVPADRITYSSVIVQKTENGYAIYGNGIQKPYFTTVVPKQGYNENITIGTVTVQVSAEYYADRTALVPYGTVFYSLQGVSEFLRNYGRYLVGQGATFQFQDRATVYDWTQMIQEFIAWAQQGWEVGTIINLNPSAKLLNVNKEGLVVQPLTLQQQNFILNQNLLPLQQQNIAVVRNDTDFTTGVLSDGDAIGYTNLNLNSFEHAVVFDNYTVFNDTIYNLTTGLRQNRLLLKGYKSAEWNGYVNANGFLINEDNIEEWQANRKYAKGQIVTYKSQYWVANVLIPPSAEFSKETWTPTNYDTIKSGLLPNPSTNAYESLYYYDSYKANLENDADLLAFSLIGYRPRQYLKDADLSDITQINVYKNIVREKGTNLIVNAFKQANLIQGQIDYDVKENWAIKEGDFGAVLNNNFVEALLVQSKLTGNPTIIGFSESGTVSGTQQTININELINWERPPTSANFLPAYTTTYTQEQGLPTAGYVNLNDVKFSAYTFDALNDNVTNYQTFYRGDVAWVANYRGSWQVFTPVTIEVQLQAVFNNLNGTIVMNFNGAHNLQANDPFMVVNFSDLVDGYYTVQTVNDNQSITVIKTLLTTQQLLTGLGITFKLVSRRFAQASDQVDALVPNSEFYSKLSWVDEDSTGQWTVWGNGPVYKQTDTFTGIYTANIGASVAYSTAFGYLALDNVTGTIYRTDANGSVSTFPSGIGPDATIQISNDYIFCSSPDTGAVLVYSINSQGNIVLNQTITVINTGAIAVSIDSQWLYVANSDSQQIAVYAYAKINTTETDEYEYQLANTLSAGSEVPAGSGWASSIATSNDGSKLFVGAPGEDITGQTDAGGMYIYARASQAFQANGTQTVFTVDNSIPPSSNSIADVYVNGQISTAVTVSGVTVTFTGSAPADGSIVTVNYAAFTFMQRTVSARPHIGGLYGASVDTNKYGAEVLVGVPFEIIPVINAPSTEGAVYRWTNGGQKYGSVTGRVDTDATGVMYIDGFRVSFSGSTAQIVQQINSQTPTNITAVAYGNAFVIGVLDNTVDIPGNIIDLVASSTVLASLNIILYTNTQVILQPTREANTQFGISLSFSDSDVVVVGATTADSKRETTFDYNDNFVNDDTIFDNGGTTFVDTFPRTGSVYEYDYLPAANETISNPGKFVFGQYIAPSLAESQADNATFGTSVYTNTGVVMVGAPNYFVDRTGYVAVYVATGEASSWYIDKQPLPMVDINKLSDISIYNVINNETLDYLDYIDPVQGKLLGALETNIDFISEVNPAEYTLGLAWSADKVGVVWLDTSTVRLLNYNQPDITYDASNWGKAFPGSTADTYTWVVSSVPPVSYVGFGFVTNFDLYTTTTSLDRSTNTMTTQYYFWVKNFSQIPPGKTLPPTAVTQYILDPLSSGISYLTPITTNIVALYNTASSIQDGSSALHIGYGTGGPSSDNKHTSWQLIKENDTTSFLSGFPEFSSQLPSGLYLKYLESFMGQDQQAQLVPDPRLPELKKYGVSFRPRQSMFVDRYLALQNYIEYANSILIKFPIIETRQISFLETYGPEQFNDGISYGRTFDTRNFWKRVDWWATGYSANTKIVLEVANYTDLLRLSPNQIITSNIGLVIALEDGLVARVTANAQGNSETYVYYAATGWTRIGLSLGTVQILDTIWTLSTGWTSTTYDIDIWDKTDYQETYWIIRWLNEQAYIEDLLIERNNSLILMFNFIQSESLQQQNYLPWLNKTSLIDVSHRVRELLPYKKFQRDNQEFLAGYLNEVKPYHVFIKDFVFTYDGIDTYPGNITDFDLPAEYNSTAGQFYSPQLVYNPTYEINQYTPNDAIWQEQQYNQWFNNYGLSISNSEIADLALTVLSADVNQTQQVIPVQDAYTMPDSGTITVDTEVMSYGAVDRINNQLTSVVRGLNGIISNHLANTAVRSSLPAVIVVDQGRGYTEPPRITAYIDTDIFPQPRTVASFTANMANDKLLSVTLIDGGSGYAVAPKIRIDSSILNSFDSANVNIITNTITIAGHSFITGDSVVFYKGATSIAPLGLTDLDYYYVYSLNANTIALYTSYTAAIIANTKRVDSERVQLTSQGTGTHQLGITARAICFTNSQPIREMTVGMNFNRVSYDTVVTDWISGTNYTQRTEVPILNVLNVQTGIRVIPASLVKYANKLWKCTTSNNDTQFNFTHWTQILSDNAILTAADRTFAFYEPTADMPGRNLPQLMTGLEYPNATFQGQQFSGGWSEYSWDTTPWNTPPEADIDTLLQSPNFTPTDDTVYNVSGGAFADGYGPEELVPGLVTDGLNFSVTTKPGTSWDEPPLGWDADSNPWDIAGWNFDLIEPYGFNVVRFDIDLVAGSNIIDFSNKVANPVSLAIYYNYGTGNDSGKRLPQLTAGGGTAYTVNWINQTITFNNTTGSTNFSVVLYEFGGGDQLTRSNNTVNPLRTIGDHSEIYLNIKFTDVVLPATANFFSTAAVYVNGQKLTYGLTEDYVIQANGILTKIVFSNTLTLDNDNDYVVFVLMGTTEGYSVPQIQDIRGSTTQPFILENFFGDDNIDNAIVEIDGQRIYKSQILSFTYTKNSGRGYPVIYPIVPPGIPPFEPLNVSVTVIQGGVLTSLTLGTDYKLNWTPNTSSGSLTGLDAEFGGISGLLDTGVALDANSVYVVFSQATYDLIDSTPNAISITYDAIATDPYTITWNSGTQIATLTMNISISGSSVVSVTSFNRTTQQSLETVYYTIQTATDTVPIGNNDYDLSDPSRLWVTVDQVNPGIEDPGPYINPASLQILPGNNLKFLSIVLNPDDRVIITSMIPYVTPGALDFRINVTKYGQNSVYRQNENTKTFLKQTTYNTGRTDDVLYVQDVTKLVQVLTFDNLTVSSNSVTVTGVLASQITSIVVRDNSSTVIPWSSYTIDGAYQITIMLTATGTVDVTIAQGNQLLIENEQIQFNSVDIENNTVSGLIHGVNGTITNAVYSQYTSVQSIQTRNKLAYDYWYINWYASSGAPLQLQDTQPAIFLQQSVN